MSFFFWFRFVAPQGVLEDEDKEHDNTGDYSGPSREDVGLSQVFSHIKEAAFRGLRINWLREPEESWDASAGAGVLRFEQAHHLNVRIHWLGNVLFRWSSDRGVPALFPGLNTTYLRGDSKFAGGSRWFSTAVVVHICLGDGWVTRVVGIWVARAFFCAHVAVNLVQHVGVEVAALHEGLRLRGVFLSADSVNGGWQIAGLESENAANDEYDKRNRTETTTVKHDKAAFFNLDDDTSQNAKCDANYGSKPQESKTNVLG